MMNWFKFWIGFGIFDRGVLLLEDLCGYNMIEGKIDLFLDWID